MLVEINGIKMEVDERTATVVETYRVGSRVKVLIKESYSGPKVRPGIIIGFAGFQSKPCIEVLYIEESGNDPFRIVNIFDTEEEGTKAQIIPMNDLESLLNKEKIEEKMTLRITKLRRELEDLEMKQEFFTRHYNNAFDPSTLPVEITSESIVEQVEKS